MFTASQLVAHMIGDYLLQTDWMAKGKTKDPTIALIHALCYSVPFWFFHPSPLAIFVIIYTHFFIDYKSVGAWVCWLKNGRRGPWRNGGFVMPQLNDTMTPAGVAQLSLGLWLIIIVDNILHVLINGLALRYL